MSTITFLFTNRLLGTYVKRNLVSVHSVRRMASVSRFPEQKFDYFLVLDFEATCEDGKRISPQEIIEFPCLKVNAKTGEQESEFHQYVQPRVHKTLTSFCTELTGIIQDMVKEQPYIEDVLQSFDEWMVKEGLVGTDTKSAFVTCGDWDLKTMLPSQCQYFQIQPKEYFKQWINIKKSFANATGVFPKGMMPMLSMLGLKHLGRHHSGIDDSKNIAAILKRLMEKNTVFEITTSLDQSRR